MSVLKKREKSDSKGSKGHLEKEMSTERPSNQSTGQTYQKHSIQNPEKWCLKEELNLLEVIETIGITDWGKIASRLPQRTALDCLLHLEHLVHTFLSSRFTFRDCWVLYLVSYDKNTLFRQVWNILKMWI